MHGLVAEILGDTHTHTHTTHIHTNTLRPPAYMRVYPHGRIAGLSVDTHTHTPTHTSRLTHTHLEAASILEGKHSLIWGDFD